MIDKIKNIGKVCEERRLLLGVSADDLASKAGVDRKTLLFFLTGSFENTITSETLLRIMIILGLNPCHFIEE